MADVVAETGAAVVIMHNRESIDPDLDIEADLKRFFKRSLKIADRAGVLRAHPARPRNRLRQEQGAEPQGAGVERRAARRLRPADPGRRLAQAPYERTVRRRRRRRSAHRNAGRESRGAARGAAVFRVHDAAAHAAAFKVFEAIERAG
jgi:dihydropteroate synthase